MSRLIDADDFGNRMYHEVFEKDSEDQRWDSGCWMRYRLFERVLREQPTVPLWIPVNIDTEAFPKDGEDVLVIDEDGDYYVAWRSDGRWWERNPFGEDIKDVRAWMPLPRYEEDEE